MRTKITALLVVSLLVSVGCFARGTGTLANPYSVKDACEAVKNLTWTSNTNYESIGDVFVKGIISSISSYGTFAESGSFGNASFYIKDKVGDKVFFCYRILYLGNKKFEAGQTDIKVGDEVIICGKLMNYRGNNPQTVSGNAYLYSLNGHIGAGTGTLDDPYTVTTACEAVKHLTWTSNTEYETTGNVYVKGRISRIANHGTFIEGGTYGNASFYIHDDEESVELYCYRILYLENKKFEDGQTDIKVGDEVIICGKLMNYRGNTPETVAGNAFLYSLNGRTKGRGDGTLANPYSAAEACAAVKDLTWTSNTNYESIGDVFVKGIISSISSYGTFAESGSFGNASFYIKDKVGDKVFFCYRILYLGNKKFEAGQTDIKVGDEVIICGKLMNYRGTPETVSGKAFLYSLNGDNGGYSFIATGVNGVNRESIVNNHYYSLEGVRIDGQPAQKGVYIHNGKKIVVK